MKATDMRSLSRDARHERRVQVIRLRKARYTYEEIATQTGLSRTGVFDICKRHAAAGAPALRDAPSGRETGEGRLLPRRPDQFFDHTAPSGLVAFEQQLHMGMSRAANE